ncbi:MAG: hypothetical protein ACT6RU_14480 [Aliihoeflea sp.]|uniref:hypothetical protein n=1 Tax=Aliihoeflea sp. TaxID=2608088 RepID=UPI004033574C
MLLVIAILATSGISSTDRSDRVSEARVLGEQAAIVADATAEYVKNYFSVIETAIAGAGGSPAVITPAMLQTVSLLGASDPVTGINGGSIVSVVRRPAAGQLEWVTTVVGGLALPEADLGEFVKRVGARGGYTPASSSAVATIVGGQGLLTANFAGAGVTWSTRQPVVYGSLTQGQTMSNYLYRTPGMPATAYTMQHDLSLGGNSIADIDQVTTTGRILSGGNVTTAGYLRSTAVKAAGDSCVAATDVGGLVQDADGKPLYCDSSSSQYQQVAGGGGTFPHTCHDAFPSGFLQFVAGYSDPAVATAGPDGFYSSWGFTTCTPPACPTGTTQRAPKTCQGVSMMNTPGNYYPTYSSYQCTIWCG